MTRVLVTGAAGFVGRAVCPALRAAGFDVAAAVRGGAAPEDVAVVGVPDIGPDTDWRAALAGVESVVHLAARVHVMKDRAADPLAEHRRINALGTRRLAEAAAAAGVGRFVLMSTAKVMGERSLARPFSESDPPAPDDAYGISKRDAEKALTDVAGRTGMAAVILRPPLVYGPGVKGNFLALMRICRWAPPLPLGGIDNRRSLIYVGNLTDAVVRCLRSDGAAGQTYFVRDGDDLSTPDLVGRLAGAMGRPARLFPVPSSFLRLAAGLAGKSRAAASLLDSLQVDDGKIRRELGWTPPTDVVQGLNETAAWLASERAPR